MYTGPLYAFTRRVAVLVLINRGHIGFLDFLALVDCRGYAVLGLC
jgi:hypothetical protein